MNKYLNLVVNYQLNSLNQIKSNIITFSLITINENNQIYNCEDSEFKIGHSSMSEGQLEKRL